MKTITTPRKLTALALLLTLNSAGNAKAQVQAAPTGQQPATTVSPGQQPAGLQPVNAPTSPAATPVLSVPTPSATDLNPIGTTRTGQPDRPANAIQVTGQSFTLQEAIRFAVRQNVNVRNSQLDAFSAEARIKEIKASALPQVSINGLFTDNLIIQRAFLPAQFFDPNASPDAPAVPVQFGVRYAGNASATVNQLIYSASLNVGLRAASTYRELAQRSTEATKVTVAEQVAKAYYGVLVAQERTKLLDSNIGRLDTLLRETRALNQQGFVEKIDVDRLDVQANNLRSDRQNVQNLIQLSYTLLKFQMGLSVNDEITLTEQPLRERNLEELAQMITPDPTFRYSSRIEYSTLETQIKLAQLDIESTQKAYYPTLAAFINYGYNNGRNQFSQIFAAPWLNFSTAGLSLQVPVFDGFLKKYQIEQKRITLQKAQNSGELLRNTIDLQIRQANITLTNSLQTLRTQQRNRDLAGEIVRITRIKYKEGVGSNIEVLNAESSLRESQTNYFAALYDFLITKVDQDKSTGRLSIGN